MTTTHPAYEAQDFATPGETRTFPNGRVDLLRIGGAEIGRLTLEPGWRWSTDVRADRRHRVVRGAALPVPRRGRAADPHVRRRGVRRPPRPGDHAAVRPRRLGGGRRARGRHRLVGRVPLRPAGFLGVRAAMDERKLYRPVRRRVRGAGRAASATAGTRRRRAPGWDVARAGAPRRRGGAVGAAAPGRRDDRGGRRPLHGRSTRRRCARRVRAGPRRRADGRRRGAGPRPSTSPSATRRARSTRSSWPRTTSCTPGTWPARWARTTRWTPRPSRPSGSGSGRWRTPTAARA